MPNPGEKNENGSNLEVIGEVNEELEQSFVMDGENELDQSFVMDGENELDQSIEMDGKNEINQSFAEYDDETEAAFKWWDKLQDTLNEAGCELDLNMPEDTARLNIFKINKFGPDNYEFKMTYATDPAQRPIDLGTITKEDVLNMQGKLLTMNSDTIVNIYQAAKNGELLVTSHLYAEQTYKQRPVYVGKDGLPVVGNDIDHLTKDESNAIGLLDPPKPPKPLDNATIDAIDQGDPEAIAKLESYNRSLNRYARDQRIWEQAKELEKNDPETYQRAYNLGVIMQQFYGNFWDEGAGEARIRYAELVGGMHREYVYRNMPEQERNLHLHADELENDLVKGRSDLMVVAEGKKITDEALGIIAKLIIDRQEMIRAQEAINEGKFEEYKPLSKEEYVQKYSELVNSEEFVNGVRNLKIGDINSLTSKEDKKYYTAIDKFEAKINSLANYFEEEPVEDDVENVEKDEKVVGVKPEEIKLEVIPPTGATTTLGKLFTDINAKNAKRNIKKFLVDNVNLPRDKDGIVIRSEEELAGLDEVRREELQNNITQEEYDYIMSNPKEIADKISKMDYFKFEKVFNIQELSDYLRTINPDYKPLPVKEQFEREEYSQKLREKHNTYAVNRSLAIAAVNSKPPRLDRTAQTLIEPHFNEFSMLTNERRKQIINSGTPEEKQAMYMEIFNSLAAIDLTKIDVMDNQSLLDNFETVADIMSISVELTANLRDAEKAGLDLTGEEYKPLIEKLAAVKEYGYMARLRVDILTNPLYSQVDISQIEDKYFALNVTKADGDSPDAGEDFQDLFERKYGYEYGALGGYGGFFSQIGMVQFQKKGVPLFDKSLSPEERLAKYREGYWTSGNELMPREPKIKKVNGEWIKKDADGYDDFVDESELGEIEKENEKKEKEFNEFVEQNDIELADTTLFDEIIDEESPKEEIKVKNVPNEQPKNDEYEIDNSGLRTGVLVDGLPDINKFKEPEQPKTEGPMTRHDALKEMFRQNIVFIQKNVDPNFSMTDAEIESYITPERIAMHEWALEYNRKSKEVKSEFKKGTVPGIFERAFFAIADKSGTPEAKQKNEEMVKLMREASTRGDRYRAEVFAKLANDVRKLDNDKMNFDKGFDAMAAYTMENVDTLEVGMDFEKINDRRVDDLGLMTSDEDKANLKNIQNKGVVIGGVGRSMRETMQSDFFLTLPFDKLSTEQLYKLMPKVNQLKHTDDKVMGLEDQMLKITTYGLQKVARAKFKEPEDRDIKPEDMKSTSLAELKEQYTEMYRDLLAADNWYNLRNSSQYKNLLTSLDQAITCMSGINGHMSREKGVELYDAIKDVQTKAERYVEHVGNQAKNPTQETRLQIAKRASSISQNATKAYVFETLVGKHNDAVEVMENEEAKTYYDEIKKGSGFGPQNEKQGFVSLEQRRERVFENGLKRTEILRAETISLEEKKDRTPEDDFMLAVNKEILEARDKLTNLVGRDEIDANQVRPLLTIVTVGNAMKNSLKDNPMGVAAMGKLIKTVSNSQIMKDLTAKVDSDMINHFLEGGGEHTLLDKYNKAMKAERAAQKKSFDKAKEAFKEKPVAEEQKTKDDFEVKNNFNMNL